MTDFSNPYPDEDNIREPFRFSCTVVVEYQTPLLATPALARVS